MPVGRSRTLLIPLVGDYNNKLHMTVAHSGVYPTSAGDVVAVHYLASDDQITYVGKPMKQISDRRFRVSAWTKNPRMQSKTN